MTVNSTQASHIKNRVIDFANSQSCPTTQNNHWASAGLWSLVQYAAEFLVKWRRIETEVLVTRHTDVNYWITPSSLQPTFKQWKRITFLEQRLVLSLISFLLLYKYDMRSFCRPRITLCTLEGLLIVIMNTVDRYGPWLRIRPMNIVIMHALHLHLQIFANPVHLVAVNYIRPACRDQSTKLSTLINSSLTQDRQHS